MWIGENKSSMIVLHWLLAIYSWHTRPWKSTLELYDTGNHNNSEVDFECLVPYTSYYTTSTLKYGVRKSTPIWPKANIVPLHHAILKLILRPWYASYIWPKASVIQSYWIYSPQFTWIRMRCNKYVFFFNYKTNCWWFRHFLPHTKASELVPCSLLPHWNSMRFFTTGSLYDSNSMEEVKFATLYQRSSNTSRLL